MVPAYAKVWYYVRDLTRDGVEDTYQRVLKCAEGAAIATDTKWQHELTTGVHDYLLNRTLTELIDRNLRRAGAPEPRPDSRSSSATVHPPWIRVSTHS